MTAALPTVTILALLCCVCLAQAEITSSMRSDIEGKLKVIGDLKAQWIHQNQRSVRECSGVVTDCSAEDEKIKSLEGQVTELKGNVSSLEVKLASKVNLTDQLNQTLNGTIHIIAELREQLQNCTLQNKNLTGKVQKLRKQLYDCKIHCSGGDVPCPSCASAVAIEQDLVSSLTLNWGKFISEAVANHTKKVNQLHQNYGEKLVPKRPEVGQALAALQKISSTKYGGLTSASAAYQAQLSILLSKYNEALESRVKGAEHVQKLSKQLKHAGEQWKRCEDHIIKYVNPSSQ